MTSAELVSCLVGMAVFAGVVAIPFIGGYLAARDYWRDGVCYSLRYDVAYWRGEHGKAKQREWLFWLHLKRLWDERDAAMARCKELEQQLELANGLLDGSLMRDATNAVIQKRTPHVGDSWCLWATHNGRGVPLAHDANCEAECDQLAQGVIDYEAKHKAADAKAFIEQASAEVQEEAVRLVAIDWDRVERALTEAKEAAATLNEARKIDPEAWNKPMDL